MSTSALLVTSVNISPASDMMATSPVGDLGIYVRIKKTLYDNSTLAPVITISNAKPVKLSLPENLHVTARDVIDEEDMKMETNMSKEVFASPEQISADLI